MIEMHVGNPVTSHAEDLQVKIDHSWSPIYGPTIVVAKLLIVFEISSSSG